MSHVKSREVVLPLKITAELVAGLDAFRDAWRRDPTAVPRGLGCSESKEGQFVLVVAEAFFAAIPGAFVIKGVGAVELLDAEFAFEEGASSKTMVLRDTPEGWRFSVKYVPPIVRERNVK
jgi:hypothetical protein